MQAKGHRLRPLRPAGIWFVVAFGGPNRDAGGGTIRLYGGAGVSRMGVGNSTQHAAYPWHFFTTPSPTEFGRIADSLGFGCALRDIANLNCRSQRVLVGSKYSMRRLTCGFS